MSTLLGPGDRWPRHQKPWWNEALADARTAGWTLNYIDAPHRFGVVSCPCKDLAERHTFMVDKTARGGETKAKEARKLIRSCQHAVQESKVQARLEECARLLDEAERLVSIADVGLTIAEARTAAWADLERIELQLETAAANLVEALREQQEQAWQVADDTDEAPDSESIGATLDDAEASVVSGESIATVLRVRKPGLARPLLDRAGAVRSEIAGLRSRLTALF